MASVERATAKAAAALLPGLLPTPPRSSMPCIIVIPPAFPNPKHPKPGRADSCARWDTNKNKNPISSSSTSSSSTSSQGSSSGSSTKPGRASSCERWDSGKRPPSRGADSAGRWDAHKKPREAESEHKKPEISNEPKMEEETTSVVAAAKSVHPVFSGPSFFDSSPEPSMLPMPAFFPRRCGMAPVPAFVLQAH